MTTFTVFVSFSGECCAKPHLWGQTVEARNRFEAVDKVFAAVRADDREPCDYVVLQGDYSSHDLEVHDGQEEGL